MPVVKIILFVLLAVLLRLAMRARLDYRTGSGRNGKARCWFGHHEREAEVGICFSRTLLATVFHQGIGNWIVWGFSLFSFIAFSSFLVTACDATTFSLSLYFRYFACTMDFWSRGLRTECIAKGVLEKSKNCSPRIEGDERKANWEHAAPQEAMLAFNALLFDPIGCAFGCLWNF